jgi:hypothetical protein
VEDSVRRPVAGGFRSPGSRKALLFASLALVPVVLFALMMLLARR